MVDTQEQIRDLIEINNDLENYFRNTIIPQLFVDGDLILKKFTPRAMTQFTLSKGDVGRPISDVKDNFRFISIMDDIKQVIDCEEILEKEIQTTDLRWYQMNIIPYTDFKSKKNNGVIITFVEITTRIKDLKEQERLISDFETLLDTISHDVKNPLTSLVLAINIFRHEASKNSNDFEPLLVNFESSIRKMQNIITELTDTRQEEHKYRTKEELLHFANILEEVRLALLDNILISGTVLKSEIHVPEITFSKRKLRSILYNLVSNAIKYKSADRKSEILIKTELEKDYIVISVKDNGVGIEPGKQDAIFSKYFRIENKIEGSGIGLYLVKEIVTNSGGKVLLKSQPGKGSEFKVYLKAK